ncbi:hypothetical protein [Helicobacter sp. 23-1045]
MRLIAKGAIFCNFKSDIIKVKSQNLREILRKILDSATRTQIFIKFAESALDSAPKSNKIK